jgi:hypothetical protein
MFLIAKAQHTMIEPLSILKLGQTLTISRVGVLFEKGPGTGMHITVCLFGFDKETSVL